MIIILPILITLNLTDTRMILAQHLFMFLNYEPSFLMKVFVTLFARYIPTLVYVIELERCRTLLWWHDVLCPNTFRMLL